MNVATSKKEGRHGSQHPRGLLVGRLELLVIIIVVGISRRHRAADDGYEDEEDEKDKDRHDEPAVIREPDEDD